MSAPDRTLARIIRREMHSSRSLAAIIVALGLLFLILWFGVETALAGLRLPALWARPSTVLQAAASLTDVQPVLLVVGGALIALVGLFLILAAVLPGSLARRRLESDRCAVVVDDSVIATAVAQRVSQLAGIDPRQIRVLVGSRELIVNVVPSSGLQNRQEAIRTAAMQALQPHGLELPVKVNISKKGVIGS
ncbi:DUF6286 domain-containing protein [Paeniglutamicibacter cryotolerans]|uniref:DNA/RNA endonuclease G n=1 Tax=Paeniglutamicibacter cryotolerans TaxID=670079 RepID=A0A839QLC8_9MICC|nr:DUF6286 domain-containing protein [Paeniglutamicibacter cryotolerans]MBB2995395.1 hypothetical protein [Paeniglutamicibacter cryotolerans]